MNASKVVVGGLFVAVNLVGFVLFAGAVLLFFPVEQLFPVVLEAVSGLSTIPLLVAGGIVLTFALSVILPVAWGVWYVFSGMID